MQTAFHVGGYILMIFVGMIAIDCLTGTWFRTGTRATLAVIDSSESIEQLLIVFPGFAMPGDSISRAFAPHLAVQDAMIVVQYAERGIDLRDISRQLAEELERLRPARLRIYGASMGGMCAAEFLSRFDVPRRQPVKTTLLLDTAPSGPVDVRMPKSLLFVSRYRGGLLSSMIWRTICHMYRFAPDEEGVDSDAVRLAQRTFASTGMPTLNGQAAYLMRFAVPSADSWNVQVDRAVFLRGTPSGGDPLITVDTAIAGWQKILPNLQVAIYSHRKDAWHVPIIERPAETMKMIMSLGTVDST